MSSVCRRLQVIDITVVLLFVLMLVGGSWDQTYVSMSAVNLRRVPVL